MPKLIGWAVGLGIVVSTSSSGALEYERLSSDSGEHFLLAKGEFLPDDRISDFVSEASAHQARFVTFDSPGGNPLAAMQLGRMIRALGLSTIQIRQLHCESACALAFVGGVERVAAPGSIGVHQSYLSAQSNLDREGAVDAIQQLTGEVLAYLKEMGVDPEFLQVSLSYGSDDMRYLSGSEMARMRVTTTAAAGSESTEDTSSRVQPRDQTQKTSEFEAVAFVESVVGAHMLNEATAISTVIKSYGETVQYYGKQVPLRDVVADKRAYFKRWPERAYRVEPGSITATCNRSLCEVSGLYSWAVRSLARNRQASGTASFSYTIETTAGMRIIGENSEVLSR